MNMVNDQLESGEQQVNPPSLRALWLGPAIFFTTFCSMFFVVSYGLTGWLGLEFRPLKFAGLMALLLTVMGLGLRRKLERRKAPNDTCYRWYRFSLTEMFVIVTGFALFSGLEAADYNQRRSIRRERERLQTVSSEVLGPDGRLGFEADGSLTISVCDRSFDDQRFDELSELISEYVESNGVSSVVFGTGSSTAGTPPQWPGLTDDSVEILFGWKDLRFLMLQGTDISLKGREKLLTLQNLSDWSKANLVAE